MTKSELLVITTSYPLGEGSSSGIFVKRLNSQLVNWFNVTTVCPDSSAANESAEQVIRYAPKKLQLLCHRPGGIPVAIKTSPWMFMLVPALLLAMLFGIARRLRHADGVVAHWSISGALAGLVCCFGKKPLVTVFHGSDANAINNSKINRLFALIAIRFSGRVVGVSYAITKGLSKSFPKYAHKITMIPNGVEESLLNLSSVSNATKIILTVANLNPQKGVSDLISAFALLDEKDRAKLIIVGDGPMRNELENIAASLGVSDKVQFVGQVAPESVAEYLDTADIFVLASYSEGRPSVVLEAMATKTAVVVTSLPGILEVVEDGVSGLTFEPGDQSGLSEALSNLLVDETRRLELASNARKVIVESKMTWRETARQYKEELRGIGMKVE